MQYRVIIDEISNPIEGSKPTGEFKILKEFDNLKDAEIFLERINQSIKDFYDKMSVNHGWSDHNLDEAHEEFFGIYDDESDPYHYLDLYGSQNRARIV